MANGIWKWIGMGGTWIGTNATGGQISFTVENGFVKDFSVSYACGIQPASTRSDVGILSHNDAHPIESRTGHFAGIFNDFSIAGDFLTDDSVAGEINPLNPTPCITVTSFKASLATPKIDSAKIELLLMKPGNMGIITSSLGGFNCGETDNECGHHVDPGTELTLTPSTFDALTVCKGWELLAQGQEIAESKSLTMEK